MVDKVVKLVAGGFGINKATPSSLLAKCFMEPLLSKQPNPKWPNPKWPNPKLPNPKWPNPVPGAKTPPSAPILSWPGTGALARGKLSVQIIVCSPDM